MSATQMQLEDWLDDLCVRFIINLPQEDLSSVARICFQVEEAQWFYEDFIRPLDPNLPSMSLRTFCLRIFQHCPLLASFSVENHTKAFEEFLQYKTRVPVRGAILLNDAMDSAVLVKGWKKGANWSFPRGKINKDEDDLDCAIREVYEETGLDLRAAGLVPTEGKPKYIEMSMREQHMRLYVFRNVPMDTNFQPRTRKEISKIQWYKLSELPAFRKKGGQVNDAIMGANNANKFYMVAPFLVPLKKWVVSQKKMEAKRVAVESHHNTHFHMPINEAPTEDEVWTQTDPGMDTAPRAPTIETLETLEGATQELQRLLKVQPPTQGLQQTPVHEDKGSALLSLLQAKGPASQAAPQHSTQVPHTPLNPTIGEAPQPHTPHHHVHHHQEATINTQQPPPSFPYPPNQPATSWNSSTIQPRNAQGFNQQLPPAPQQQFGNNQATLVHPQPLPPQVQRSVFNRSAFQDGLQPKPSGAQAPYLVQNPQTHYIQPEQAAPQHSGNARPAQLSGQSLALLNAFKSGPAVPQSKENARYPQEAGAVDTQQYSRSYGLTGLPQGQPQGGHQQIPSYSVPPGISQSPKELAGSRVAPPADDHRSALLGMFRKTEPQAATGRPHIGQSLNAGQATGENVQLNLLAQLQARSPHTGASTASSQQTSNLALPLESLSLSSNVPPAHQQTLSVPHPTRILQRGRIDPAMASGYTKASPQMSPHAQPISDQYASPPVAASLPLPGRRPESGQDQKRQLLSLFGRQQQSPLGLEVDKGKEVVTDISKSRVASLASGAAELGPASTSSSRRGSQTPISPAERNFLLGYLESVTNSASR